VIIDQILTAGERDDLRSLLRDLNAAELAARRGTENKGEDFEKFFNKHTEGYDYFVVTAKGQFEAQTDLREYLYANYPVYSEGNGYLVFDLKHPFEP